MTKHNQNVEQLIISSNKNNKQRTETLNKKKKPKITIIAENKDEGEENDQLGSQKRAYLQANQGMRMMDANWGGVIAPAVGTGKPNAAPSTLQMTEKWMSIEEVQLHQQWGQASQIQLNQHRKTRK